MNKKEQAIYKNAITELKAISDEIVEVHQNLPMITASKSGLIKPDDKRISLVSKFSTVYFSYIDALEAEDAVTTAKLVNTHEMLTRLSIDIIDIPLPDHIKNDLIKYCTEPDRQWNKKKILWEGHFFGEIKKNVYGNYLHKHLNKMLINVLASIDNVDETAMSNLLSYYKAYINDNSNLALLGCALHYIQDIIAPPHAANYPNFIKVFDNTLPETHHSFEKKAKAAINTQSAVYRAEAAVILQNYKKSLGNNIDFKTNYPANLKKFAKDVYDTISGYAACVYKDYSEEWDIAINKTIPVAIAASAVILESVFKK